MKSNCVPNFCSTMRPIRNALILLGFIASAGMLYAEDPANRLYANDSANRGGVLATESLAMDLIPATPVLIDFETFPDGSPVAGGTEIINQYQPVGVTFGSVCATGATLVTNIINFVTTVSSPNSLVPCGPAPKNGGTMILTFTTPVTDFSVSVVDDQFPVQVTAFNQAGAQVGQTQSDGSNVCCDQVRLASAGGIKVVRMVGGFFSPDQPDGWAIDNLGFTPLSVCPLLATISGAPDGPETIDTLYRFRDEVMGGTYEGRRFIHLYYRHAAEAGRLVLTNRDLRAQTRDLLGRLQPKLQARLDGGTVELTAAEVAAVERLMNAVARRASGRLRWTIWVLRQQLRNELLLARFGFRIAN